MRRALRAVWRVLGLLFGGDPPPRPTPARPYRVEPGSELRGPDGRHYHVRAAREVGGHHGFECEGEDGGIYWIREEDVADDLLSGHGGSPAPGAGEATPFRPLPPPPADPPLPHHGPHHDG